jgi:hypothetical protein
VRKASPGKKLIGKEAVSENKERNSKNCKIKYEQGSVKSI